MDWFEKLTGFREANYDETRAKLSVEGSRLRSLVNSKSYEIGQLELVSLQTLRKRAESGRRIARPTQGQCRKRRRAKNAPVAENMPARCSKWRLSSTCWK